MIFFTSGSDLSSNPLYCTCIWSGSTVFIQKGSVSGDEVQQLNIAWFWSTQFGWRIRDKPTIGWHIIKQATSRWNGAEGEGGEALGSWCLWIGCFEPSSVFWGLVIPPFKVGDQVALSGFLNIETMRRNIEMCGLSMKKLHCPHIHVLFTWLQTVRLRSEFTPHT